MSEPTTGPMTDYRIPDDDRHYVLHVSGGRTSGYMLRKILDAHGGTLPDNARAIFTNTGKEREETLEFLAEMEGRWDVPITWLEYTYRTDLPGGRGPEKQKNWYRVVNYETARRAGEPFAEMIVSRQMLPTVVARMCTEELKVNTVARYCRWVLGWIKPISILGIRYDERRRWEKALFEECRTAYPMVEARHTVEDVTAFWRAQPFDLTISSDQGNCDLCFLKGVRKLRALIRAEPERAQWWIDQEDFRMRHSKRKMEKPEMMRFLKRHSYTALVEQARQVQELPLDEPEGEPVSCFCGD